MRLVNKNTGEVKEQEIFMGDFPIMTQNGTFVINGAERVVVSQLVRSPGVYFTTEEDATSGRMLCYGKLIPNRGAWLEFETSNKDVLSVKVDRKRKIPVTTLLRAICSLPNYPKDILGTGSDEDFYRLFREADNIPDHPYIARTIDKEPRRHAHARRRRHRVLQAPAPRRSADAGQRPRVLRGPVLPLPPL